MNKILAVLMIILSVATFADESKDATTTSPSTLAVLDFQPKGVPENIAEFLTEQITIELFKSKKYKLLERGKMADILNEQKMQLSGLTGSSYTMKVGELLAAGHILSGNINKIGDKTIINAKLVDVQSGVMEWGNKYEVGNDNEYSSKAERIVTDMIGYKAVYNINDNPKQDDAAKNSNENLFVDTRGEWHDNIGKIGMSVGAFVSESVNYAMKKASERMEENRAMERLREEEALKNEKTKKTEIKHDKKFMMRLGPIFKRSSKEINYAKYDISGNMIWMGGFMTFGTQDGFSIGGGGCGGQINGKTNDFAVGYGGPMISLNKKIWIFKLNGDLLVGAGGFSVNDAALRDSKILNMDKKPLETKAFFVFEPSLRLGIEPFQFFEAGVEYGYQYLGLGISNSEFSSSTAGVYFAFGF